MNNELSPSFSLKTFPLLAGFPEHAIETLKSQGELLQLPAGTRFIHPGQKATGVYLLLEGAVQVLFEGQGNSRVLVRLFTAPAFFGENDVLTAGEFIEDVECILPSKLFRLDGDVFRTLLKTQPVFAARVLMDVSERFRNIYVNQGFGVTRSVEARLANVLLAFATAIGEARDDRVAVDRQSMTYEYLGGAVGATSRSVQRTFNDWREQGVLERQPRIWLVNTTRLQEIVGPGHPRIHHAYRPSRDFG